MYSIFLLTILSLIQTIFAEYQLTPAGELFNDKSGSAAYYSGGNSILVVGGYLESAFSAYSDISEYNILTQELKIIGNLPEPRAHGGSGTDGNKTYFYFGESNWVFDDGSIYKFSQENPNPDTVGNVGEGVETHMRSASVGNGTTYLYSGYLPLNIYQYQADSNQFTWITSHESLNVDSVVYVDGLVYSLGRINRTICNDEDCTWGYVPGFTKFNPQTLQIQEIETVLGEDMSSCVPVVVGTNIYLVGGHQSDDFELHKFDTKTETIEKLEVELESRFGKNLHSFSTVYVEDLNRIYIFGGIRYYTNKRVYQRKIYYIQL